MGLAAGAGREALRKAPAALRRTLPKKAIRRCERALDAAAAAAKVAAVLALKMAALPALLGTGLDKAIAGHVAGPDGAKGCAAAASAAGGGAAGACLARWVLGITFMLAVTVAVLQLRERLHPAALAGRVRPHEPRPDLLATLLAESATLHAKRLATSFAIYGALLVALVYAPAAAASPVLAYLDVGPFRPRLARVGRRLFFRFSSARRSVSFRPLVWTATSGFGRSARRSVGRRALAPRRARLASGRRGVRDRPTRAAARTAGVAPRVSERSSPLASPERRNDAPRDLAGTRRPRHRSRWSSFASTSRC